MKKSIKILYVDPLSPVGHINFNNIYISALLGIENLQIGFIFQEGYRRKLNIPSEQKWEFFSYDVKYRGYKGLLNKIAWRIDQLRILTICKKLFRKSNYDYIFFSSFDEISLLLSGLIGKQVIAVCHANAEHIPNSKISLFAHKIISCKASLITLNKALSIYMSKKGINNTFVPHGLPELVVEQKICKPYVFIPVQSDLCNKKIMTELVSDKVSFVLQKRGVKLILKENPDLPHNLQNIIYTDKILSMHDYTKLYNEAGLILLPYNIESYVFRTSAMLMEAIAYNKNLALPRAKSFLSLTNVEDEGMFFYDSVEDIIDIIETLFSSEKIPNPHYDRMKAENAKEVITRSFIKIINDKE